MSQIPKPICAIVGKILGDYYTHSQIDALFTASEAPGDPPKGNRVDKCIAWLKRVNETHGSLKILGRVLKEYMEAPPNNGEEDRKDKYPQEKQHLEKQLAQYGLYYQQGGIILQNELNPASKDLEFIIQERNLQSLLIEYERARDSVELDPPVAITAATAIFESFCKVYIDEENIPFPPRQTAHELWKIVREHLNISQKTGKQDDEFKSIINGLESIVNGFVTLRIVRGQHMGKAKNYIDWIHIMHALQ